MDGMGEEKLSFPPLKPVRRQKAALGQSVSTTFVADCTFEWRGRGVEGVSFVSPKLPQLRTKSQQFCRRF